MSCKEKHDIRSTPKDIWEYRQDQEAEKQMIEKFGIDSYKKRIKEEIENAKKEFGELPFQELFQETLK